MKTPTTNSLDLMGILEKAAKLIVALGQWKTKRECSTLTAVVTKNMMQRGIRGFVLQRNPGADGWSWLQL